MENSIFIKTVWDYYKKNKRSMPWREDVSPYSIFISEVMLQQTQVARVLIKYLEFIRVFPDFTSLAKANSNTLLSVWQGMGYNRRALYLRDAARIIIDKYDGVLPSDINLLDELPGIGRATASAMITFAYNIPIAYIETNIRRIYIHHFFSEKDEVMDCEIMPIIEKTIDRQNPRKWYWALMDYGAYLGRQGENVNVKSKHYAKQKKFAGSVREVRGGVLRELLKKSMSIMELKKIFPDERLFTAVEEMEREGFIERKNCKYKIK